MTTNLLGFAEMNNNVVYAQMGSGKTEKNVTAALASIRTTRNGDAINSVLRDYYHQKCESKKKKVALVAVMHKLLNYIFAVLRDEKPFALRSTKDHQSWRHTKETALKLVA